VRFALLAMLVIGCEPDLDGTAFLCDPDHACPGDQTCIDGRCRRVAPQFIACGGATTCFPDQQCCVDNINPPRCIAAADRCPGRAALCDSMDDCAPEERCCNATVTACGLHCETVACEVDPDCPSDKPHCCPQGDVPWGECELSC
jgi:hypothetical protein